MPKLRVHNFTISLDGFAAGSHQRETDPRPVEGRVVDWLVG